MGAVIFDDLARLWAAVERFERDCPAEWTACGEWVALGEAVRAVEDAVAEAWPPTGDELFDEPEEEPSPGVIEIGLDWAVLDAKGKGALGAVSGELVPLAGSRIGMISEPQIRYRCRMGHG